jgi:hypothetical protein
MPFPAAFGVLTEGPFCAYMHEFNAANRSDERRESLSAIYGATRKAQA